MLCYRRLEMQHALQLVAFDFAVSTLRKTAFVLISTGRTKSSLHMHSFDGTPPSTLSVLCKSVP